MLGQSGSSRGWGAETVVHRGQCLGRADARVCAVSAGACLWEDSQGLAPGDTYLLPGPVSP